MMFNFFGGLLGYAYLHKSPISIEIAPALWRQILGEELTLADLNTIDAYSSQVLKDLQQFGSTLSDEAFTATINQNFTTVLSNGVEVPLCDGGESKEVTKQNLDEFISLVLKARANEAELQLKALRAGLDEVFNFSYKSNKAFNFLSWESLE